MPIFGIILTLLCLAGVVYLGYGLYKDIREKRKNKKGGKDD